MNHHKLRYGLAIIGLAALIVAAGRSQQADTGGAHAPKGGASDMSEEQHAMMEAWMKIAAPGEHHKHLNQFVGTWDTTTKMWMAGPDGPATESKGTSTVKWVLGGRYILEEHHGSMMGMPYEGMGLTGYDNFKNLYVGSWFSNMDTQVLSMTGMRHPKTGTFTAYGTMDEPMMNVYGRTVKYITRIISPDKHVFSIVDLHAGDDYTVIEITYERKK